MNELQYNECRPYLASNGYKCEAHVGATYRGSVHQKHIVTVEKNGQLGFVQLPSEEEAQQLLKICDLQDRLPIAAKIVDVIDGRIFIIEQASGILLWEIEDDLPAINEIEDALGLFVRSLEAVGLTHGDIRPWNVFYDASQKTYKVIDWGFSFFQKNGPSEETKSHLETRGYTSPYRDVDQEDVKKTIQVIMGNQSCGEAWLEIPGDKNWHPKWAKKTI